MDKSIAYILNSAPGVGETTLMKKLHEKLPNGFALIDGDDVGKITPYENNFTWLNLMQDNIVACCSNFKRYEFSNCVISFVFPTEERLERIRGLLNNCGFEIVHIILECDEGEMCKRITERNTSRLINLEQAKELNQEVKSLHADFRLDTTNIEADEVASLVIKYIFGGFINETN